MDVRLDKVIPLRKQIGYMNMLKTILKRLANSVQDHVPKLFKILLALLRICALCLEQRAEVSLFPFYFYCRRERINDLFTLLTLDI